MFLNCVWEKFPKIQGIHIMKIISTPFFHPILNTLSMPHKIDSPFVKLKHEFAKAPIIKKVFKIIYTFLLTQKAVNSTNESCMSERISSKCSTL